MEIVKEGTSFRGKALTALGISVTADALDYFAAPIVITPIIGDIFDSFIISLSYSITKESTQQLKHSFTFQQIRGHKIYALDKQRFLLRYYYHYHYHYYFFCVLVIL